MRAKAVENGKDWGRRGIPDGWARRKEELRTIRAQAKAEAKEIVAYMNRNDLIEGEDFRGDEAIEEAIAIVRAKNEDGQFAYTVKDRLAAMKLVAEFTKAKPTARQQTTLKGAEDWLGALAAAAKTE